MKKPRLVLAAVLSAFAWAAFGALAVTEATDTLQGEVLEAKDVDAYTYLRLRTSNGNVWAAVPQAPVRPGSKVTIFGPSEMRDFKSRGLGRSFESIYFGVLGVEAKDAAATASATGAANQPVTERVPKAEGRDARTVAEVVGSRSALQDKPVTIRARVHRVNQNVMGKNWVHLRDGTGTPAEENYDLLVTSAESPEVGKVVIARGIVRTDVDLGVGHAFKVLVEGASFK
jgi:hypothetical protein